MADEIPTFEPRAVLYAHDLMFQALIVTLIASNAISVDTAQRIFDIALQRAKRVRDGAEDVERLIQHTHDSLNWDHYHQRAGSLK